MKQFKQGKWIKSDGADVGRLFMKGWVGEPL